MQLNNNTTHKQSKQYKTNNLSLYDLDYYITTIIKWDIKRRTEIIPNLQTRLQNQSLGVCCPLRADSLQC